MVQLFGFAGSMVPSHHCMVCLRADLCGARPSRWPRGVACRWRVAAPANAASGRHCVVCVLYKPHPAQCAQFSGITKIRTHPCLQRKG